MREGTKRRIRILLRVILAGMLIGIGYGSLIRAVSSGAVVIGGLIGAVHGLIIATLVGLVEIFGERTRVGRKVERAPLVVTILVKGLLYGTVITVTDLGHLGDHLVQWLLGMPVVQSPFLPLSVAFSFAVTFAFIFVMQMGRLVGVRTLRDLLLGRYHQPRAEERFFLFVDVVGSTGIAERLGPLAMHRFLNRVFSLAADPVADQHGEIHQYVGDEMVVTWTIAEGRISARPVACFFAIEEALALAAQRFERDFGVVPALRGALHAGPVVTGEVGEGKREIVFHGDVMNAAARLERAAKERGHQLLVSREARSLLLEVEGYGLSDLGPLTLRGRTAPVQVFAVTRKS